MAGNVAELLYHTTLTVVTTNDDTLGATRSVFVLGTNSTLETAKKFASTALQGLNYQPDDFVDYAVHKPGEPWTHGDGVVVYAKAPAGQEFLVGLDTTPNNESLAAGPDGTVVLPPGTDHLHYVLQTKIDYDQDRAAQTHATEIEGCYVHRADALAAAKKVLGGPDAGYAQYDARDNLEDSAGGDWPFGEDVLVHAVAETGENYTVAIRTVPGAHKKHAKSSK